MTSPDSRKLRATSQMTEEAIIGCAIRGHVGVLDLVLSGTREEDFIDQDLRTIRSIMDEFAGQNPTADMFARALERDGKLVAPLTRERLRALIDLGCMPVEIEWQLGELRRLTSSRAIIGQAEELAVALSQGPSAEGMTEISSKFVDQLYRNLNRAIDTTWVDLQGIENDLDFLGRYENAPISTGLKDLDDAYSGGLRPGTLTVLAGSTGIGKSSLALGIALAAAENGYPTAFFTVEMTAIDVRIRAYGAMTGISHTRIRNNDINEDEMQQIREKQAQMSSWPLKIEHRSHLTTPHIRAIIQRMNAELAQEGQEPIRLVVIDYLQLLQGEGSTREERVSRNSAAIANMTKDETLNRPAILTLSQLRRADYTTRSPGIDDLRESGSIGHDAESVMIIDMNDRGNDADQDDRSKIISGPIGETTVSIVKNRDGGRCVVPLYFRSDLPRFEDLPDGGSTSVGGETVSW